jgi:DNA polymerase I-like protein with 3'-5' exonuclease and polymerase domains
MLVASIDFETSKRPRHMPWHTESFPVCLGMVNSLGEKRVWWFSHTNQTYADVIEEITSSLREADLIVAHNLKFELGWTAALGADAQDWNCHCTMVAEYLLRGQFGDVKTKKGRLGLNDVAARYKLPTKKDRVADYWEAEYETDEVPMSILEEYVLQDCELALAIATFQRRKLREQNLTRIAKVHMELVKVLSDIESSGMLIDKGMLEGFSKESSVRLEEIEKDLRASYPLHPDWNINSGDHVSALLFGGTLQMEGKEEVNRQRKDGSIRTYERKCKIPVEMSGLGFAPSSPTKKDGVYTVDADALAQLTSDDPTAIEILELLKEHSQVQKQQSTYHEGLLERIGSDSLIHPSMNQTITATGRLSSSNPNGQNFPRGSTSPVKRAFKTRW